MTTDSTSIAARLRQAREERGWTLGRVAHRLDMVAQRYGRVLPDGASVRAALERWEAGQTVPDADYRRLLCAVFEADPAQLGFPDAHRVEVETVAALLYVSPFDPAELVGVPLDAVRRYVQFATDQPQVDLGRVRAGLATAAREGAPWLDTDRLMACRRTAVSLVAALDTYPPEPDWLRACRRLLAVFALPEGMPGT